MNETTPRDGAVSIAGGPIAALMAAGLLGGVRSDVGSTNVALLLAAIVMIAALAGRTSGIVTAITAALAFNYFHAAPYHSLRIEGGRDVVTVVLLALLGLMVSEISAWRRRGSVLTQRSLRTAHSLETTTGLVAGGAPADEVFAAVREHLVDGLGVTDCRFEAGPTTAHVLPRSGSLVATSMHLGMGGFELPTDGAALAVVSGTTTFGHIVLTPGAHRGSTLEARRAAIALADLYALALSNERSRSVTSRAV